ncbi:MAG: DoxX family protein [Gemmatimonadota bacterium]|nr:DoxX family protein [Gemmatimonadota bacterium]
MGTYSLDPQTVSIGLLVVRIVVGLIMAAHGASKLWGWFGGHGLRGTGQFFEQMGFHPGAAFAAAASVSEIVSGLLVAVGFLGPIGPALMISVMVVAAITVHLGQGLLAPKGLEMPLLYGSAAFGLALTGFGEYSLDALLGVAGRWSTGFTWIVLMLGVAGAFVNLAFRRRPATASA